MKRRILTPFSLGLALGLFTVAACLFAAVFSIHNAAALSQSGPDSADFATANAYYTLSNTVDVVNETSMGLSLFHSGSAPTGVTNITVSYQGGAGQCANQNSQGNGGAHFTYGVGAAARQTTISIPASAWASDGTGYIVSFTGTLQNGTNSCGGGGDGNHVNFKLAAPAGFIVGPTGGAYFGMAQGSYCLTFNSTYPSGVSCNGYATYNIPFAPPCTAATSGSATASIYDMDNTGHPVIQPSPAVVHVIDTTTGATVNNNSYSGSEANAGTANFAFTYQPHHNYKLQISNANLNNVLQIKIPFDSVNAQVNCAPFGGITSDASAACTVIQGWTYQQSNPATQLQYMVAVNPASAPTSYSTQPGGTNFIGPYTADLANPSGAPGTVPANHGMQVNVPAQVTGHGYNGPWGADSYYIYTRDINTGTWNLVASLNVPAGTCAHMTCGSSNFSTTAVGLPDTFDVNMNVDNATPPPGNPKFTVTVTGSGSGTNSQTFSNVNAQAPSGGKVYSDDVTFTPAGAGTYTVSWSYYTGNCGSPGDSAGFAPFFQSLGGDISAGSGFGGSCSQTAADIKTWNLNTDAAPNYFGGGSEIGAWATGRLTNFVSGMGLTGGAGSSDGYGLSFTNTSNTGVGSYGGGFDSVACMRDYYGSKPGGIGSVPSTLTSFGGSGSYTAGLSGGTFTLGSGSDMTLGQDSNGFGKQISIYVNGDAYIQSNVLYSYGDVKGIPRLNLFVRGNIYINPNVTNLHGVYVAQKNAGSSGFITTCAPGVTTAPQPYATCNKQLVITGSAMAEGGMRLNRTFGSLVNASGATNQPAEVFQYSPELWLSAGNNSSYMYQAYTSLPPVL